MGSGVQRTSLLRRPFGLGSWVDGSPIVGVVLDDNDDDDDDDQHVDVRVGPLLFVVELGDVVVVGGGDGDETIPPCRTTGTLEG